MVYGSVITNQSDIILHITSCLECLAIFPLSGLLTSSHDGKCVLKSFFFLSFFFFFFFYNTSLFMCSFLSFFLSFLFHTCLILLSLDLVTPNLTFTIGHELIVNTEDKGNKKGL